MKTLDFLGLDNAKVQPVAQALNQLLADYQVFYANLRGFHWNVRGKGFFTLHEAYEKLYNTVAEQVDEVAERILQLGERPENRYSEYLKVSNLKEDGFEREGRHALDRVLDTLKTLIAQERAIIELANEANDDVTAALMGDYLKGQEKLVWMLLSFLEKKASK
jgi:DNA protection during starvation protein 2